MSADVTYDRNLVPGGAAGSAARQDERESEFARQVAELANLYVTSVRFHEAVDREEVLTVVSEVVQSLVGSESFGFFELREGGDELEPALVFGLDPATTSWASSTPPPPAVADAMARGEIVIAAVAMAGPGAEQEAQSVIPSEVSPELRIRALVPFRFRGVTTGILVVFELLPHKRELDRADIALLELISTHAATSLRCVEALGRVAPSRNPPQGVLHGRG